MLERLVRERRRLALGIVLGILTTIVVFVVVPAIAHGICDPDNPETCSTPTRITADSPKQFVRQFNHNRYSHVKQIHYKPVLRRKILRAAHRAWNRKFSSKLASIPEWHPKMQWNRFIRQDNCVGNVYPTNMMTACTPDLPGKVEICDSQNNDPYPTCNFPSTPASQFKWNARVAYCGLTLVPALFTGGSTIWIGWGGGTCFSGFFIP
jgi:hypothetical protein